MKKIINKILVLVGYKEPTINWEEGDVMQDMFDDKPVYWAELIGYDELGREYSAVGEYHGHPQTHSELIEIEDIERI